MDAPEYPETIDPRVVRIISKFDADTREFFEERAAIIQFDGELPRDRAEREALGVTLDWLRRRKAATELQRQPAGTAVRGLAVEASESSEVIDPRVARVISKFDASTREFFEERAAIIEFEGEVPRDRAEREALGVTLEWLRRNGKAQPKLKPKRRR